METSTNANPLEGGAKAAEKWFNDSSAAMMEIYNKQLNVATNFYKNLSGMGMANNSVWNPGKNFTNTLFGNNDLTKWMFNPFSSNGNSVINPFAGTFEKAYNQLTEYNRNLFSMFNNKDASDMQANLTEFGKKYQESLSKQMEASKQIMNSFMEAFNKQVEVATESDKKLMEELNGRFTAAIKQTQDLWANMLNSYKAPAEKEERSYKEDGAATAKKPTRATALA